MKGKPDFAFFDVFKQTVDEKIVSELNVKIDKLEVKKTEQALRRKLQKIEKEVEHIQQADDGSGLTQPFIR